jgi:hypothetical protein
VGVELTAEQVAALTHDIVWLEDQVVDGEHVLVPRVVNARYSYSVHAVLTIMLIRHAPIPSDSSPGFSCARHFETILCV